MKNVLSIAACAVAVITALSSAAMAQSSQPYSGMQNRPIKALSDVQVADLKAGRGMGLALAAELNGYPGPSHLLELSEKLGLTSDQHSALKGMFDAMNTETIPIGENLIVQEERLDHLFAEKTISEQQLKDATKDIGETQGRLRNSPQLPSEGACYPSAFPAKQVCRAERVWRRASGTNASQAPL